MAEHAANIDVYDAGRRVDFVDDPLGPVPFEMTSPYTFREGVEASAVPILVLASWMDAGTARGALARFVGYSNPQHVVIGAWTHGGDHKAKLFKLSG